MENRREYKFSIEIVKEYLWDLYRKLGSKKYHNFMSIIDSNYIYQDRFILDTEVLLNAIENGKVSQDIIDQIIEFQIANL